MGGRWRTGIPSRHICDVACQKGDFAYDDNIEFNILLEQNDALFIKINQSGVIKWNIGRTSYWCLNIFCCLFLPISWKKTFCHRVPSFDVLKYYITYGMWSFKTNHFSANIDFQIQPSLCMCSIQWCIFYWAKLYCPSIHQWVEDERLSCHICDVITQNESFVCNNDFQILLI